MVASLLFGVRPSDPLIFALVPSTIAAVSILSSWIPARRASRLDPIRALRSE
jgi:ABC-type lipoprotein release transport system permease subunit